MGIKNLNKFLKKHIPSIYVKKNLADYRGKTIAIDTNVYLHYFRKTLLDNWIQGFFKFICSLKKHNIIPVFIYDSVAPIEKNKTKEERREKRKKIYEKIDNINKALEQYNSTQIINDVLKNIMKKYRKMSLLSDEEDEEYIDVFVIKKELNYTRI